MPNLYIIAGPNGAGKTTIAFTLLPEALSIKEFVNADEIARGISPFNPESVAFQAGRVMLNRIDDLLASQVSFSIETTLTTLSYLKTIERAKVSGYQVILIYIWLKNPDISIARVKQRVKTGGHSIPEEVILRRYSKALINLPKFTRVVDEYYLFENSGTRLEPVALYLDGQEIITNLDLYKSMYRGKE